jgi:hypothetical protein
VSSCRGCKCEPLQRGGRPDRILLKKVNLLDTMTIGRKVSRKVRRIRSVNSLKMKSDQDYRSPFWKEVWLNKGLEMLLCLSLETVLDGFMKEGGD